MIKVEHIDVHGFEAAIRGMRNPMNSWDKSDSNYEYYQTDKVIEGDIVCCPEYLIGENDLDLMQRLYRAGTGHRKYLRMITVTMDITCHQVWWSEYDTYKVGTVRNSCSKMHKIHVKEFVKDDFSHEGIDECGGRTLEVFEIVKDELERLRNLFNETHEKKYWRAIIELLPSGYNMRATVMMDYETVFNIINQRSNHKVDEWKDFVNILLKLPYVEEIKNI